MQFLMTVSKQSQDDSAWKRSSKSAWNLPVPNVGRKLLMMCRENARNM